MELGMRQIKRHLHSSQRKSPQKGIHNYSAKFKNQTFHFSFSQNFKPLLEDEILKKTMNSTWQSRYFCLTSTRLIYFSNSHKKQIKGCFNLASLSKHQIFMKKDEHRPILRLIARVSKNGLSEIQQKQLLTLNFQSRPEKLQSWKSHISAVLDKLHSYKKDNGHHEITNEMILSPTLKFYQQNFWNQIYITNEEFLSYGHHLDIVFFKSKDTVTNFQRILMGSEFDHVALILRNSKNELLVLEAIESRGVWVNEWKQMLPTFQQCYEKIGYRKLMLKGDSQIDFAALQSYIESIIGNNYELSLSKLLICEEDSTTEQLYSKSKRESFLSTNPSIKSMKKSKTFFCSELLADIYIKFGLIKGRKRNEFWPKDFENDLKLQLEASLSPLMYLTI